MSPQDTNTPSNNIYLLTGEDEHRKTLSLSRLKDKLLGSKPDAFNYSLYYAKTSTAQEVIRSLDTLPLTGENKLVVLKEPEFFKEADKASLICYLKALRTSKAFFVMVAASESTRSDKFSKSISGLAKVFDFPKLESTEVTPLIIKEFKLRNKLINRRQAELICEASQRDLGKALPLIEQVSIFTSDREKVTDEEIMLFTGDMLEEVSAFKLLDLINQNDTSNALIILKKLLRADSNPSQIIGLLGWHIGRLLSVKNMLEKGISKSEIASSLKIGTYVMNRLIAQAESFSLKRLRKHLDILAETDLLLKRSSIKGDYLLEILTVKLSA